MDYWSVKAAKRVYGPSGFSYTNKEIFPEPVNTSEDFLKDTCVKIYTIRSVSSVLKEKSKPVTSQLSGKNLSSFDRKIIAYTYFLKAKQHF